MTARALFVPMQASRNDTCLVEHDNVFRPDLVDDISKRQMPDTAVMAAQGHQPGPVTAFGRILGDEGVGKIEVELFDMHYGGRATYWRPARRSRRNGKGPPRP